jgi:hypothetical protein
MEVILAEVVPLVRSEEASLIDTFRGLGVPWLTSEIKLGMEREASLVAESVPVSGGTNFLSSGVIVWSGTWLV